MQLLKSLTFVYVVQQDRILAAINAGSPEAWSCWLTRRVVLALLDRAADMLGRTSSLAQRAPSPSRSDIMAFEHQAALATTAPLMRTTPPDVLSASAGTAELIEKVGITPEGEHFRLVLSGLAGGGAAGVLRRVGFQRIVQMLRDEVAKAGWVDGANPNSPEDTPPRH